jgi:hypothetical protein
MAKDNIFPLYLTAPAQSAVGATAWNGSTSNVLYAPTGNVAFTVGDAVEIGTVLSIRKTNATAVNLTVNANASNIVILSNEHDTVTLIWDGNDWQIYSLSDIPASLSATSLSLAGNLSVAGTSTLNIMGVTGASTFNTIGVTGASTFGSTPHEVGATATFNGGVSFVPLTATQASSRTTGVTLNTKAGSITSFTSNSGAANAAITFTVTNAQVTASSVVLLTIADTTTVPTYARVSTTAAGSFNISYAYSAVDVNTSTKFNFLVMN